MNDPLHSERRATALELTLNRPAQRNALSADLIARLTQALRTAGTDLGVRSIILTGTPPAFCAGLDLRELARSAPQATQHDAAPLLELYETIDRLPKPIIAAVNGAALAGGAILACVCDVVIGAETAQIGFPGIRHGLVAPLVMPYVLRRVGEGRARYVLLTGQPLSAQQSLDIGLADEIVAETELLVRARQLAAVFAGYSPPALAEMKAALVRLRGLDDPGRQAEFRRLCGAVQLTDASRESLARYLES